MNLILNSYNTTAAGTSNVTRFILTELLHNRKAGAGEPRFYIVIPAIAAFRDFSSSKKVRIIRLPLLPGVFQHIFRIFYEVFFLPIVSYVLQSRAVVILANYAPAKIHGKKVVFVRHPHLVTESKDYTGFIGASPLEWLRQVVFRLTLLTADHLVVQSHYMKERLLRRYGGFRAVSILPNPVSNLLKSKENYFCQREGASKIVLYVSRFYPHKGHSFLLRLAERYQEPLREADVRFHVTIDPRDKGGRRFLEKVDEHRLSDVIRNIGEVANEELALHYQGARCLFFPSRMETFGNPLVEAMAFQLPIVVPDLDYAHAVCEEAGLYFRPDDIHDAYEKLFTLLQDDSAHRQLAARGREQFKKFPTVSSWIEQLMAITEIEETAG
jgi:glycosyltransferase involved in cell wall biosynthesis